MEQFSQIDTLWMIIATIFIFMMQPGFAMLEAGFTRTKNAGNVVMKNLLDFVVGSIAFWVIGFGLLMGEGAIIGKIDLFAVDSYDTGLVPKSVFLMFQTVFCGTAATIVSGAMAERTRFSAYLLYSFIISAIVYPIEAHWIWGGGWLSTLTIGTAHGFRDCAGGTAVHVTGGISAFMGALVLGPRIGKYDKNGNSRAIPGHSVILSSLGIFLLWFAWFGFNTGSLQDAFSQEKLETLGNILLVTNLTAACSGLSTMALTWIRYGKADISMTINGILGGLVASTAGCSVMPPWAAVVTGGLSGALVLFGIEWIDKKLHVDDPVGACGVHGLCGAFGSIMVGLYAKDNGLLTTGHYDQLLVQLLGVVSVGILVSIVMGLFFVALKKTIGLRVTPQEEINGLDAGEHNLLAAYATIESGTLADLPTDWQPAADTKKQMPTPRTKECLDYAPISCVVIICKPNKLEQLKKALNEIGVMGITTSQVAGCGVQKGQSDYYRGTKLEIALLPKIRLEIVVSKISVDQVVDTVRSILYTGHIGDGKIFVYDVRNVIKVRTGEEGEKALQDPESYQELDL